MNRPSESCRSRNTNACACVAHGRNSRPGKNAPNQGEGVFVSGSLTRTRPGENALRYDGIASGPTLYGYVLQDPINGIDPYGLANFMLGGNISLIAVGGFTLSGGIYVSFGHGFDIGVYGSAGGVSVWTLVLESQQVAFLDPRRTLLDKPLTFKHQAAPLLPVAVSL